MVTLWGSNNRNDRHDDDRIDANSDDDRSSRRRSYNRDDADERTRLLGSHHVRPGRDGYLDPDDPAVSPYNLWTVRFLRYMTIFLLAITLIWWIILLVSMFVSLPAIYTRGSGFFEFSFVTLTAGNLFVSLLFFANPSQAMRLSAGLIAVFLLLDMLIIVTVRRIRHEEGWVGIASVVWAVLMAAWCVVTDRVVAWGKREEEQRLTGRPETRRTVKEWLGVLAATIFMAAFFIVVLLMTGTLILRITDSSLDMDGTRYGVDGNKYDVHLACVGEAKSGMGSKPTLLLEAAEHPVEYDFEHWAYSAYQNGTIDRYCYWDRPGYAWSDNAPSPHSAGMSADALSEALALAGEKGPWLVVSAGYGSIISRIFSARHLHDVVGLMLIDPLHEDLLDRVGSARRGFMLWGWGILSPLGIPRLIGAVFQGRTREDRVYGRSAYRSGKFIKARLQENLAAKSLTRHEVTSARTIQNTKTPFVLISSGTHMRDDREWGKKQEDLTKLTANMLSWDVVKSAPHSIWQSPEGREVMGKRLNDLLASAKF